MHYNTLQTCPSPYTGNHCLKNGPAYSSTEHNCCDITTGKATDGTENKICCEYAASVHGLNMLWDGNACVPCPNCQQTPPPPDPPDPPDPNCENDPNHCYYVWDEIVKPKPYVITKTETYCAKPCVKLGGTCCLGPEYRWDGAFTCDCCTPSNDEHSPYSKVGCFRGKGRPTRIEGNKDCMKTKTIHITVNPDPYVRHHKKCVNPCPDGYSPLSEIPREAL